MRRFDRIACVLLLLVAWHGLAWAKGSDWKEVEFKGVADPVIFGISDGTRVYALATSKDGPPRFFLLDKGVAKPVQAEGRDMVPDINMQVVVGGRLVAARVPTRSDGLVPADTRALYVLEGEAAKAVTVAGKQLDAGGGKLIGSHAQSCPYFHVLGGDSAGLYKLSGTEATATDSPKVDRKVELAWANGKLAIGTGAGVWIYDGTTSVQLTDTAGQPLKHDGTLELVGPHLAMIRYGAPSSVYSVADGKATAVDFGKDVHARYVHNFNGVAVVYCETGSSTTPEGRFFEVNAGKAVDWKPAKGVNEKGSKSLMVCGSVALLSASDGSNFIHYRVDAKGAKRLTLPKDLEGLSITPPTAVGPTMVYAAGVRGQNFTLATIDANGKVEAPLDSTGKPFTAGSIGKLAGADGFYAFSNDEFMANASFRFIFRAAK